MHLRFIWVVTWFTMLGLVVTPIVYLNAMMNDPIVENSMSADSDSWGIPTVGDLIVGIVLAAIVYGLTKSFTKGYTRPSLFAWRPDRLTRSIGFTLLAVIIILLPMLAIGWDFYNGAPPYEYVLIPLLILGIVWAAMLRAAAITQSGSEEPRAPIDW